MTAIVLVTTTSIGLFLLIFWMANVVPIAKRALATTRGAVHMMRDPSLDEFSRERAVQAAAIKLVAESASLILRSLLPLVIAFVPILLADWAGIAPRAATLAFMERWDVIVIATVIITLGYIIVVRVWSR